jgi:ATP-dependent RNA helicase DHX29
VDRRFAQNLPRLDIDPLLREKILGVWLGSQSTEGKNRALHRIAQNYISTIAINFAEGSDSEDRAIARLGINYGVLRRLGFKEDLVEECLRSSRGMDLEDIFDWVNNTVLVCRFKNLRFLSYTCVVPKMK